MKNYKDESMKSRTEAAYTSRRAVRRRKSAFRILLASLIVLFLTAGIRTHALARESSQMQPQKYYTSMRIEYGDTLESIAQEHMSPEYASTSDYIKEVKQINGLSDSTIHAGEYLTIPYYTYENKTAYDSEDPFSASAGSSESL